MDLEENVRLRPANNEGDKMTKRILIISLIVSAGILAQNASASLPFSTYGQANGWQGYAVYNEQGFNVVVRYAVYDNLANAGEFNWDNTTVQMPPTDRYIYAYQVFNVGATTDKDIGYLSILDIHKNPIAQSLMHGTKSQTDGAGGKATVPVVSAAGDQGTWTWAPDAYVKPGDHSWYLVFSSDRAPVNGKFEVGITPPDSNLPHPGDGDNSVPEPTSIALLSLATGLFAAFRKKKTQAQ
jgi:hypothetical protein